MIRLVRDEIDRLRRQNETLDYANELVARENERLRKQVDALQATVHNLTRKLAAYHESQRTPEQADDMNDQREAHAAWEGRDING